MLTWFAIAGFIAFFVIAAFSPGLLEYMTLSRFSLDANHFWIAAIIFLITIAVMFSEKLDKEASGAKIAMRKLGWIFIVAGGLTGILILLKIGGLSIITQLAYTGFDISLAFMALITIIAVFLKTTAVKEKHD